MCDVDGHNDMAMQCDLGVKLPATPPLRGALDDEELFFIVVGSKSPRNPGLCRTESREKCTAGLLEHELYHHRDVHNTTRAAPAAIPQFSALSVPKLVVAQNGHDNKVQELQLWNLNGLCTTALCIPVSV